MAEEVEAVETGRNYRFSDRRAEKEIRKVTPEDLSSFDPVIR